MHDQAGVVISRRTLLKTGLQLTGGIVGLGLASACGTAALAPTTTPADDVQKAYDAFVAKEMPGVPIDLVRAAKAEGQVTWYSPVQPYFPRLVARFQELFPFINVELTQLTGGALAAKFLAESRAKQTSADLVTFTALDDAQTADKEGFVAAYKLSSESEYVMTQGVSGKVFPASGEIMNVGYNPTRISDADAAGLKNWSGLLDKKWDGKRLAVGEIATGGTTLLLNYYFSKTKGTTYWERFESSAHGIYSGTAQMIADIVSGAADLAIGTTGSNCVESYTNGAPIHWVNSSDWLVNSQAQCVTTTGNNPNAAKLLQEFRATVTGQGFNTASGAVSFRKGVVGQGAWTKEPWYIAPDPTALWSYTNADLSASKDSIVTNWRSIVK
jgi:iron(III) transport system substrate-binding protein